MTPEKQRFRTLRVKYHSRLEKCGIHNRSQTSPPPKVIILPRSHEHAEPNKLDPTADPASLVAQLHDLLRRHEYEYYILDAPTISDAQYDTLMNQLKALEAGSISLVCRGG